MKTKNNAQKTGNRKFRSSAIRVSTLIVGFVLIVTTTFANGLRKHSHENNSSETVVTSNAFVLETSVEKKLEIENWMINEKCFGSQTTGSEMEAEESLKVEDWMLTNQNFSEKAIIPERESVLKLEDWMLDPAMLRK